MENKITTICGSPKDLNTWIYKLDSPGVFVHEMKIESAGSAMKKTEIVQITDVHLNAVNSDDENDEEVMYTKQCRHWNENGESIDTLKKAMEYANKYDCTVITGDTMDYLSHGAMELMQKHIWDVDENCIVSLGGHDITKQMETGMPDKLPLEERMAIAEAFWKHDMYYFSKVINEHVMVIQMDNGCHKYWESQIPKLQKDIQTARENGYTILIFQHEPICTGKSEDAACESYYVWDNCLPVRNFYDKCIGYEQNSDEVTMEVYKLITQNADVVRGVFCGHYHTCFHTEIKGSYTDKEGKVHFKNIPQHMLECNVYSGLGHVLKIEVI